jgi:hypothetical protein
MKVAIGAFYVSDIFWASKLPGQNDNRRILTHNGSLSSIHEMIREKKN